MAVCQPRTKWILAQYIASSTGSSLLPQSASLRACSRTAIRGPSLPWGGRYGMETILDDGLKLLAGRLFRGGRPRGVGSRQGKDFLRLMGNALRGEISHHVGDNGRIW